MPKRTGTARNRLKLTKGLTIETRQSKRGSDKMKYNPYGEEFVIDRIVLSDMMESLVGFDEIAVPREIDLVNDVDQDSSNQKTWIVRTRGGPDT